MAVRRFDTGELRKPERLPNGWLRVDAYLTRCGVFVYRNRDGSERRELRLPEDVFHPDAVASFQLVPATNLHPPEELTAENTKQYAVGVASEAVQRDGDRLRAPIMVYDAQAIADIEGGRQEISCGYAVELEESPGVHPAYGRYDVIQRRIRGNHVAFVDRGRAGPDIRVRMDGDAFMVGDAPAHTEEPAMKKIKIGGVEYEVTEQVAQAYENEQAQVRARLDSDKARADSAEAQVKTAKAEVDQTKARLDAKEEELKKEQQIRKDAEDPKKLQSLVAARVSLEVKAREVLGAETRLDGLNDREVKVKVLEKLGVSADKLKDQSDAYVQGRFDAEIEKAAKENPALEEARKAANGGDPNERKDGADSTQRRDPEAARKAMIARQQERWKQPAGKN
jgi:hypothetical protein